MDETMIATEEKAGEFQAALESAVRTPKPCDVLWCEREHIPGTLFVWHEASVSNVKIGESLTVQVALTWAEAPVIAPYSYARVTIYITRAEEVTIVDLAPGLAAQLAELVSVVCDDDDGGGWLSRAVAEGAAVLESEAVAAG